MIGTLSVGATNAVIMAGVILFTAAVILTAWLNDR